MPNKFSMVKIVLFALFIGFLSLPVVAGDYPQISDNPATLDGYSPVSYFEEGKPQKGSSEYQSTYKGNKYWFTSEEQKKRFDAAPADFAPAFPHNCPYNLAMGRSEPIDPTNFKIIDGQLLLFHRSAEQDGRKEWERTVSSGQMTDRELLRKAENNLLDIQF